MGLRKRSASASLVEAGRWMRIHAVEKLAGDVSKAFAVATRGFVAESGCFVPAVKTFSDSLSDSLCVFLVAAFDLGATHPRRGTRTGGPGWCEAARGESRAGTAVYV